MMDNIIAAPFDSVTCLFCGDRINFFAWQSEIVTCPTCFAWADTTGNMSTRVDDESPHPSVVVLITRISDAISGYPSVSVANAIDVDIPITKRLILGVMRYSVDYALHELGDNYEPENQ